ncbi:MAG: nucleotidyltransferase domain-containing protein [Burkholderiales bacterium]|nr:nucleotidyltransferase domain-containing protein [Burkholderiales bacterium]
MPARAPAGLLSTREFAERRGVSRQRVLALLAAGRVAGAARIGGRWAIPVGARIVPPGRRRRTVLAPLTPLENALLREFAERVRAHAGARLERIVVFGSRARGGSHSGSDLDVAVFLGGAEDRRLRRAIYRAAAEASAALEVGAMAWLEPAVIFAASPRSGLAASVEREGLALPL